MGETLKQSLQSFAPFDLIPPEAIGKVARFSFEKDFRKGETIFVEGASPKIVWFVKRGRVHLEKFHSKRVRTRSGGDERASGPRVR